MFSHFLCVQAPDYFQVIKSPMDFLTMKNKVQGHEYRTIDEFEADFDLIVKNCMLYNSKDTVFYRAAIKLRDTVWTDLIFLHYLLYTILPWETYVHLFKGTVKILTQFCQKKTPLLHSACFKMPKKGVKLEIFYYLGEILPLS